MMLSINQIRKHIQGVKNDYHIYDDAGSFIYSDDHHYVARRSLEDLTIIHVEEILHPVGTIEALEDGRYRLLSTPCGLYSGKKIVPEMILNTLPEAILELKVYHIYSRQNYWWIDDKDAVVDRSNESREDDPEIVVTLHDGFSVTFFRQGLEDRHYISLASGIKLAANQACLSHGAKMPHTNKGNY